MGLKHQLYYNRMFIFLRPFLFSCPHHSAYILLRHDDYDGDDDDDDDYDDDDDDDDDYDDDDDDDDDALPLALTTEYKKCFYDIIVWHLFLQMC